MIPLAIAAGAAGLTGLFIGAGQASAQNRAVQQSRNSNLQATQVRNQQIVDRAAQERLERIREAQRVRGRARVALSGSVAEAPLLNQAAADTALNLNAVNRNTSSALNAVASEYQANDLALASRRQSVLLQALIGGLQGVSTGLSIGQAISGLSVPQSPLPQSPVVRTGAVSSSGRVGFGVWP